MSTPPPKSKKNKLTPVGFRVNDEVYDYLQAKAHELSQEYLLDPRTGQYVTDPQTGQPKKILESAHIGLLVREATFAYIEQYEFLKKKSMELSLSEQVFL
jgi:hypothetical protein